MNHAACLYPDELDRLQKLLERVDIALHANVELDGGGRVRSKQALALQAELYEVRHMIAWAACAAKSRAAS